MIFIVVKFQVRPEWVDRWLELVEPFTAATRAEPGNLWFTWSRNVDDPGEFILVEAFADDDAGRAHVTSEHFADAMTTLPQALVSTPKIVSQSVEQTGWGELGEMTVEPPDPARDHSAAAQHDTEASR